MTGVAIRGVFEAFGLSADQAATLLGVNTTTIYRWYAYREDLARVEPLQLQCLKAMVSYCENHPADVVKATGLRIRTAGGGTDTLMMLRQLLQATAAPTTKAG